MLLRFIQALASLAAVALMLPAVARAEEAPAQAVPAVTDKSAESAVSAPAKSENGVSPMSAPSAVEGGEEFSQPPVSREEIRNFKQEFQNLEREGRQLLKQLRAAKGTEDWVVSVNAVLARAGECRAKVDGLSGDEQREFMNDCRNERLWDGLNEIREQFVPPAEIKNALRDIANQTRDIKRYDKQLAKLGGEGAELSKVLLAQLEVHKNNIVNAVGRDQRDALQEYREANLWEEVNKIRARVELPRELKNITREFASLRKDLKNRSVQKALEFFGVDQPKLTVALDSKQAALDQVLTLVNQGNAEDAFQLMQEEIHQGWHPGDVREFVNRLREAHERFRGIRDEELKAEINSLMKTIVEEFNGGEFRSAREALGQFMEATRRYERIFRPYYRSGGPTSLDNKARAALERLDTLIQEKFKEESKEEPKAER